MHSSRVFAGAVAVLSSVILASSAAAIPLTTDDFEDGSTMGWFVPGPHPAPPTNIPTGGPAGVNDNYLQLTSTGNPGAGGRLAVLNESQWTGDFIAAGVRAIVMDVNNFGPSEVTLRLLFVDIPGPPPPANLVTTLADVVVPAGSGWVRVKFSLSPSNLTALLGTVNGALANVDDFRIFHNPDPAFPGPPIGPPRVEALLGVDNIRAVPEPTAVLLLAGGLGTALCRMRRRSLPSF